MAMTGNVQPLLFRDFLLDEEAALRLRPQQANLRHLWGKRRDGAARRGIAWHLDVDEFDRLVRQRCYYCGRAAQGRYVRSAGTPEAAAEYEANPAIYGSLDRVLPGGAYALGQVVPACLDCQRGKGSSLTPWTFRAYVARVARHLRGRRLPGHPGATVEQT